MSNAILVLAGGASSRWDRPKALIPWGADCLVNHLARVALAAGGSPVLRVLGAHANAIAAVPAPSGVADVFNLMWARGMGRSIAVGLRAAMVEFPKLEGVVILPCDLPLVTAAHLRSCLDCIQGAPSQIAQSDYGSGVFDHPSAFGHNYFDELLALEGDEGVRSVVARHLNRRVVVSVANRGCDLDTDFDPIRTEAFLDSSDTRRAT
jgi:molybdenum cofactor cytidylyltransferase